MLDYKRLEANKLLVNSGWSRPHKNHWQGRLAHLEPRFPFQVPADEIFESARDIIDALDGIQIRNQCAGLGLGSSCSVIDFDFFNYDASIRPELEAVWGRIGKRAVYIGIGFDIIGDWLVDENGALYFQNNIRDTLTAFSQNIYDFLEKDIYRCGDLFEEGSLVEAI